MTPTHPRPRPAEATPRRTAAAVLSAALAVLALFIAAPLASAQAGTTVQCESTGWSCAGGGYSDSSRSWADKWYYAGIHNCTRYAAHRLAGNGMKDPGRSWGNAGEWLTRAPGDRNDSPAVGAIAWWSGHVAYVEEVGADYIVVTEDNASPYLVTRRKKITRGSAGWPTEFLHIHPISTVPTAQVSWTQQAGTAKKVALTRGSGSLWTAFHIGSNNVIYRKTSSQSGWTEMPGTSAKEIAAFTNPDGRVEVFHIGSNGRLYHSWQSQVGGGYSSWTDRGGEWRAVAVTRAAGGYWQAFTVGMDRAIYRMAPGEGITSWTKWSGTAEFNRVAAFTNPDGRIEVLAAKTDGSMHHSWQSAPRGAFGSWARVPGTAVDVAIAPRAGGGWHMYHVGNNRGLYVRNGSESGWRKMEGATADTVAAAQTGDSREVAWHVNTQSGGMYTGRQGTAGSW